VVVMLLMMFLLLLSFGQYVQVHAREMNNSMSPRTEGAIALMSAGNLQGSYRFYNLRTGQVVTRANWTVLPISGEVIDYLNSLAAREEHRTTWMCPMTVLF